MRKFFAGAITALLLGIVTVLGLSLTGFMPIAATSKEPAPLAWLLHTTYEKSVQRNAANITVPADINSGERILKGAKNFAAMCAGCHTAPGVQRTAVSAGLNPPPPVAADLAGELTAAERFWVIKNGVKMTGMPAFGPAHDDDSELWALVAFTEKLPTLSAESYQQLVKLGKASMPEGDGHAHSHMNEPKPDNNKPAETHGAPGHHSDTAKQGAMGHHPAPAANEPVPDMQQPVPKQTPDSHDHSGHSH